MLGMIFVCSVRRRREAFRASFAVAAGESRFVLGRSMSFVVELVVPVAAGGRTALTQEATVLVFRREATAATEPEPSVSGSLGRFG